VDAAAERPTTDAAIYKDVRRVVANRFPAPVDTPSGDLQPRFQELFDIFRTFNTKSTYNPFRT
jgi:hypothetical protein